MQLDLLLNNIKIELVSNFTFLGIILDSSITIMEISPKNYCDQKIKNNWYFTQVKKYFSEKNSINNIQITNCATFELWSTFMGSKS